jgi:hypothetical protein
MNIDSVVGGGVDGGFKLDHVSEDLKASGSGDLPLPDGVEEEGVEPTVTHVQVVVEDGAVVPQQAQQAQQAQEAQQAQQAATPSSAGPEAGGQA